MTFSDEQPMPGTHGPGALSPNEHGTSTRREYYLPTMTAATFPPPYLRRRALCLLQWAVMTRQQLAVAQRSGRQ